MRRRLSLLAVFAHPDDESCGPGATLAMYASRGVEVTLVCATKGERGAWGDDQGIPLEQFGAIRVRELACACTSLGIRRWAVLGYPDGALAQAGGRRLEEDLVRWIRQVQPQMVVTHYPLGPNGRHDHDVLSRLTARAYLGAGHEARFPEQLNRGLAPWEPLKLYYAMPPDPVSRRRGDRPLTVTDATEFADAKIRALSCHRTQEECWRMLSKALQNSPRWKEFFYLAHSRVPRTESPEDDLFASIGVAEGYLVARQGSYLA